MLRGDLSAEAFLLGPQFPGGVAGGEVCGLEDLADLDLGAPAEGGA